MFKTLSQPNAAGSGETIVDSDITFWPDEANEGLDSLLNDTPPHDCSINDILNQTKPNNNPSCNITSSIIPDTGAEQSMSIPTCSSLARTFQDSIEHHDLDMESDILELAAQHIFPMVSSRKYLNFTSKVRHFRYLDHSFITAGHRGLIVLNSCYIISSYNFGVLVRVVWIQPNQKTRKSVNTSMDINTTWRQFIVAINVPHNIWSRISIASSTKSASFPDVDTFWIYYSHQ